MATRIQITSTKNTGTQILQDYLTTTEKKILAKMINEGMKAGKVRNKEFYIKHTGDNTAEVHIYTTVKSIILNQYETTRQRVTIKYS